MRTPCRLRLRIARSTAGGIAAATGAYSADDADRHLRSRPPARRARALRLGRRVDAAPRRARTPRARASWTSTAAASSTSPAASAARTPATASRRSSTRSRPRPTPTCTSASWSASTSRTSRPAGCSPSCRRASAPTRSRSSSTRAPRRTRTPSRSRASFTGRPAVIVFDNAFHGRTLLTMTMTSKVKPYKAGFGPFAPEVYRAPAPYPYRGVSSDDAIAGLERLFKSEVDPATVACVVLEPVQGEGGFVEMPPDYPARLLELCRGARDPVRGRRGAVGRRPHREDVGDRALRRRRARPARLGEVDRRRAAARRGDRARGDHGQRAGRWARRDVRRQPALVRRRERRARGRARAGVPRPGDRARRDAPRAPRRAARRATRRSARCAGSGR